MSPQELVFLWISRQTSFQARILRIFFIARNNFHEDKRNTFNVIIFEINLSKWINLHILFKQTGICKEKNLKNVVYPECFQQIPLKPSLAEKFLCLTLFHFFFHHYHTWKSCRQITLVFAAKDRSQVFKLGSKKLLWDQFFICYLQ